MSTKAYVKDSSAYSPSNPYVRDSGSWKPVTQIFGKVGGVWSSVFTSPGSLDRRFVVNPGFNERVFSTVSQSDGKILVGGTFTSFNGTTVGRLVRLNSDGTLDTAFTTNMGTGFDNSLVYSIVPQSDGKMLVGGGFSSFNGTTVVRIARLNSDGTLDTTFATNIGTGFNSTVDRVFLQSDGKILVGGRFTNFNGTTAWKFARLNSDGTLDTDFMANIGTGFNNTVDTIFLQSDGKILVGGDFTAFNGGVSNTLVRLDSDGTLDSYFTPGPYTTPFDSSDYGGISSFAIQPDGKIVVTGLIKAVVSPTETKIARLNSDGTVDTAFMANVGTGFANTNPTEVVALQPDGKILVGGDFGSFNGTTAGRLVRLNSDGTVDTDFMGNIGTGFTNNGPVRTISLQSDGKILVGGKISTFNGINVGGFLRLNSDGTLDTSLSTQDVRATVVQSDGKILVGGRFDTVNNNSDNRVVVKNLMRINSDGTPDTAFKANIGVGIESTVRAIALQSDGKILVGGQLFRFNGDTPIDKLIRLNSDGTLDTDFLENLGTSLSGTLQITQIVPQSDGKIVISGTSLYFDGKPVGTFLRLKSDGTPDFFFPPSAAPAVDISGCKEVDGGKYLMATALGTNNDFGLGPNYNGLVYFNL